MVYQLRKSLLQAEARDCKKVGEKKIRGLPLKKGKTGLPLPAYFLEGKGPHGEQ